jgi:hypothetical protein
VDPGDDLGPGQVEEIGVAGDVVRVVAEALAPVGLLPAQLALDEHAPGPVQDGDPLAEAGFESLTRIRHFAAPVCRPRERGLRPRAL